MSVRAGFWFTPLLSGRDPFSSPTFFTLPHHSCGTAVKLIYYYGVARDGVAPQTPPAWELYDLQKDPGERINVSDDPAYGSTVRQLKAQLAQLRTQVGDDGRDFPEVESVVQEFWEDHDAARAKAVAISHAFHAKAQAEREAARRSPKPRPAP